MYSEGVKEIREQVEYVNYNIADSSQAVKTNLVYEKWLHFPISKISHHGTACCEIAREWLFAMDFSQLNGGSPMTGPRWIRQRFNWGPTKWQIHWCEAIEQKTLDCGAQAALANEVFLMRGVRSYQIQLVQQYSKEATSHWTKKWVEKDTSVHWINEDLIYHEGCAVAVSDTEIKLWDASTAWWINPQTFTGYGSLRAVRLFAPQNAPSYFNWGKHRIVPNEWQCIEACEKVFAEV
jgi:hypothetical protein